MIMSNAIDYQMVKQNVDSYSTQLSNETQHLLLSILKPNLDELNDIIPFINYSFERIESIKLLLEKDRMWDAEIIFRSLLEVFVKLIKIMSQNNHAEIRIKLDEFWIALDEIEQVRDSDKAKEIIKSDRILNLKVFKSFILTEEEEQELKSKPSWSNRQYRNSLKNDWSLSGILINLIKNHPEKALEPFVSYEMLQHYYKIASHIAHGDGRGLSDIITRKQKQGEYAETLNLVHYFKFVKTITIIPLWISYMLAIYVGNKELENKIVDDCQDYDTYVNELWTPVTERLNEIIEDVIFKKKNSN